MAYDVPCRPTPLPARAPIPSGWCAWSHGHDDEIFRTILGVSRPVGMILVERCCRNRGVCEHCRPAAPAQPAGAQRRAG